MFSPERFGPRRASFGTSEGGRGRNFIGLKTAFRNRETRTPLQKAAHFRFSEPATPSVLKDRGLRPSDLSDPHKKQFLTELTGRIFHLAVSGVDHGEEGDKKISLERLFTPATDSGDLTPVKKKAYASSSFYRPDHPTIDDQVELAQRISFSLVDENNKMSRGQSMYMKRKKRSMRWIHQGGEGEDDYSGPGSGSEAVEEEPTQRTPTKPAMKLLMNPKGVQDFHAVQEHYQALMDAAPPSPEVGKIVTEVQSPTGKGAELFAKRKKRMDKFIVDETTVQKAQQQTTTITQQSFSSQSNISSTSTSSFSSKKQAEYERNQQQEQILISSPHIGGPIAAPGTGAIYTAEVKVVQRASLPPTPVVDMPHHSLLELSSEDKSDKRRSLSFNLAAKGWGTYNKFYTPITFAT